ncbi:hypothetical protein LPB03_13850 [Polaribacter vadi]|nr:hypothetical protein LPB03_13850 [Polaribacter vadi]
MTEWKKYEKELFTKYSEEFPDHEIKINDKIIGQFSKVKRQIDISIRKNVTNYSVLGIIECKYYNRKVDVKIVDCFIGFLDDIKANFGIIITNKGFTQAAKNRAEVKSIKLHIHKFENIENLIKDVDYYFNQRIKNLELNEQDFYQRVKEYSNYIDFEKVDFEKKVIVFKNGFTNTEYYAWKKLMQETSRVFRDFPEIERIEIITPAKRKFFEKNKYIIEDRVYKSNIELNEFEIFMKVNFSELKNDVKIWRKFLNRTNLNNKNFIQSFAKKYVTSEILINN